MFNRKKREYITFDEMNERLERVVSSNHYNIILRAKKEKEMIGSFNCFIEDKQVEFTMTYKEKGVVCTYICRKDGAKQLQRSSGLDAFIALSKYYKVPRRTAYFSASPILYKNNKFEGQRHQAYGYDLNSSYSFAMLKPMPDTSKHPRSGKLNENEIGFSTDGDVITKVGKYATIIFPLMESPFKRFVETWYTRKKTAKTPEEKQKAKDFLNMSIGYLQRVNPFIRATILYYANKLIEDLIDENTLYCNTDSIVSLVPRNDLKLGTNIGEWKIEHTGNFAFIGLNYQWNNEVSYRGIPKSWFPNGYDILNDPVPTVGNIYEFNKTTLKLEKVEKKI